MTNEKQMECQYLTPNIPKLAIVLFGDRTEVFEQEKNVLKYFKLNADEYEYEEIYKQKEPECTVEVTFRLYLCSSDYAVQVVRVLKKENENG